MKRLAGRVLLVSEGGDAPGYMAAATSLTEEAEKRGYEVFSAFEGFRSLTGDNIAAERLIRLTMSRRVAWKLNAAGVSARAMYRHVDHPGSEFRSERYPQFKETELQRRAASYIEELKFDILIVIGGDGALRGAKALAHHARPELKVGFVNVSVDSDVGGDISIGYLTGIEEGAKIARGLLDDAYTHKRIYFLETMGRDSGKHALFSGASARAHLIILPGMRFSESVMRDVADRLNYSDHALIVVAEGYKRAERKEFLPKRIDAAKWFKDELFDLGLRELDGKRIISEPFSRYIRGARPLYLELGVAYLKALKLFDAFERGESHVIPYYLGEGDYGVRSFDQVESSNLIDPETLDLVDRFKIDSLRAEIADLYGIKRKEGSV